ncbi:MAG: hypothetical protein AB7T63_14000 [Planctomycetota bacterium]
MSPDTTSTASRASATPLRRLAPWLPLVLAVPLVAWALVGGERPEPERHGTSPATSTPPPPAPVVRTPARVKLRFATSTGDAVPQAVFFLTWEPAHADPREDVQLQWGFHRADDDGVYVVDPAPRGARLSVEVIDPELHERTQVLEAGVAAADILVSRLTPAQKARLKALDAEIAKPETQAQPVLLRDLRDEQARIRRGHPAR